MTNTVLREGQCPGCGRGVYLVFLSPGEQGETGRPIMSLGRTPLRGAMVVPRADDTIEAWTARGQLVHVRTSAQLEREGEGAEVYIDHLIGCPRERRRRQRIDAAPQPMVRIPDSVPGDTGECDRCGSTVVWIQTASGRMCPVDPVGRVGYLLSREEAAGLKGDPRLVRGFRSSGDAAAIRECAPADPIADDREITTVHVAHFATCPAGRETPAPASA